MNARLLAALACLSLAAGAQRGVERIRVARKQAAAAASATPSLSYWGGHVIPNVKVYQVNWTSSSQPDMSAFFAGVTNSSYLDWLQEYDTNVAANAGSRNGTPGTQQLIGRGTFAGAYSITPSSANAGGTSACAGGSVTNCCLPDAPAGFKCIDDGQVSDEISKQIAAGHLPPNDENSLYFVYFPPNVVVGQGGTSACQAHSFCAYHGTLARSGPFNLYYAVMPDFSASGPGCDLGCGKTGDTQLQKVEEVTSHEMVEAITDAEVGIGSTVDFPLAWYDATNGEAGDICDGNFATAGGFSVQQIWSNKKAGCTANRLAATDFNVSLGASAKTMTAGGSTTLALSSATTAGRAQSLALSVAAPSGIAASFDKTAITSGSGATLALSADTAACPLKDHVVQVVARNDAAAPVTHTASFLLNAAQSSPATDDFCLSLKPPSSTTLAAGTSADYAVASTVTHGAAAAMTLAVQGLPAGVTASFASTTTDTGSISSDGSDTLTLSAAAGAADQPLTTFHLVATTAVVSAGRSISSTVGILTNDFSVAVSPKSQTTLAPGGLTYSVKTARVSGAAEDLTLAIDSSTPLPSGVTASFSPTHVTAGGAATLTLQAASGAPASGGPISFDVTAADAAGISHSDTADVTVTANDFSLSIAPGSAQSIGANGTAQFTVTAAASSGAPSNIDLSVGALPAGVTGAFDVTPIQPGSSATLTLTASGATPSSATAFTVTGLDDEGLSRATTGSIQVLAGDEFGIAVTPATVTLARGTQNSLSVTTTAPGVAGTVAFSTSGLPAGVTSSFSPASVTAGGGSTLTLSASSTALIASGASFSITGTSGGIVHSANATISVTGAPGKPLIAFAHPDSGATLSGAQEIDLTASAAAGSALQTVALSLTDAAGHATSIPPPAGASSPATTFFWNTTEFADGAYTLVATATDADSGTATATLGVTVDNSGGGASSGGGRGGCLSSTGAPAGALALLGLVALRRRKR